MIVRHFINKCNKVFSPLSLFLSCKYVYNLISYIYFATGNIKRAVLRDIIRNKEHIDRAG